MSIEENKAIAMRDLKEVLEQGHVELLESYYAPDGTDPKMWSLETYRDAILSFQKTCPGYKITILDMMAEGDKVMASYRIDLTYSVPDGPPPGFFPPLGKPVSWINNDVYRIVDGKLVWQQGTSSWMDMLVESGVIISPDKAAANQAAVRKFIDAVNRRDNALLGEVCTPEEAKNWIEALPGAYAMWKDHHIELVDMVADGEMAAVKMATSGYHSGEAYGLPPTGKWWTNTGNCLFYFRDGKISKTDFVFEVENHIKQLGGEIRPVG